MRVVSLVPSSTETLLALGADVIACTRFCEQPGLRQVGGTKNPDLAAIRELRPDVVVLDRQENRIEDAEALEEAGIEIFVSDVRTVADSAAAVAELAGLVGAAVPDPAADRGLHGLPDSPELPGVTSAGGSAPLLAAFVPIWRRPWMTIGPATYGASVLDAAGCGLVTTGPATGGPAEASVDYPVVELADVAAARPPAVLVPSEPYDFTAGHLDDLRRALPGAIVERIDGRDLFWWGIRTPAALGRIAVAVGRVAELTSSRDADDG